MDATRMNENNSAVARLGALIAMHAPYDGLFPLRVPGVSAIRVSSVNKELTHAVMESSMCLVAQGAKTVMLGEEVFQYAAAQIAVYSVDLPIAAQITQASAAEPYLNLKIELDAPRLAELAVKVFPNGLPPAPRDQRALYVANADAKIVDASIRLLELMSQPAEADLVAPLVLDEILIRLLRTPMGPRVAQIGLAESGVQRVAKAVTWLRANFDQPVNVEELAGMVNMSVSSFHRQFKGVTSMSPLQYQKALRLQEARRLMLTAMLDAGEASRRVGYVSASQFSREYGRFFGAAPTRDVHRMREEGVTSSEAPA